MTLTLSLTVAAVLLAIGAANAEPTAAQNDDPSLRGTVSVCVRWDVDPHHVADAVVVAPSGNKLLDRSIPGSVRGMTWDQPDGDYHGEWIGITLQVAGGTGDRPLPKCDPAKLPS
jgi:hypothetical protein